MMKRIIAAAVMACAFGTPSASHEFYDGWCCNGEDCAPYYGKVEKTRQGYYLPEFDTLIPYKNANGAMADAPIAGTRYNVPDGEAEYHICFWPPTSRNVRCFYARPGGV